MTSRAHPAMPEARRAIGVFDSGVGGLTVLRRIAQRLPQEPILYLGDTARVPYGTKSANTVIKYAMACSHLLDREGIKLLVVACNTASAYAIDALREAFDFPVIGVVEPGARAAIAKTRNRRVGVIGTVGTVQSGAYSDAIRAMDPEVQVFTKACPLFVPLAEEGWTDGPVPRQVAQEYLGELMAHDIDTLVLGCTHYPLLADVIAETVGDGIALVDSAEATSLVVAEVLEGLGLHDTAGMDAQVRLMVTDAPANLERVSERFLGYDPGHVEWVDFNGA